MRIRLQPRLIALAGLVVAGSALAATPLELTCSSNLTVTATSSNGAVVDFTCAATGGCEPKVVSHPPSGSLFPVGTTTVLATASDSCGGSNQCSFDVTVLLPPLAVNCSSNLTVSATSSNGA